MVGRFYGMLLLSAKFKTSWQMGEHLTNCDLENQFQARSFRLVQWLNIILFLRKTSQDSTNLARKCLPEFFSGYALCAGEFGKEIFWSQALRSWKFQARQKSMLGDSMQRRFQRRKW